MNPSEQDNNTPLSEEVTVEPVMTEEAVEVKEQPVSVPPPIEPTDVFAHMDPVELAQPAVSGDTVESIEPMQPTDPALTAEVQPVVALPIKKSKKGLLIGLIVAGAVVVGLATAGIVYAVIYNNPNNVVMDALTKALMAKSSTVAGVASIKAEGTTLKADFSSAMNETGQATADSTVTVSVSGKDYTMKGHFAGTKDEIFVKVDDFRSLISGVLGSEYSQIIEEYYGSLLDKVDGKWVVIKQSDIDSLSDGSVSDKETQCFQGVIGKIQTDASLRNEVVDAYKKNPLFIVSSKGSDSDGNHYSLAPVSNDKAKNFSIAIAETKFFKALDDCTSSDLKQDFTDSTSSESSSSEKATGSLDVWVDGWSHNLNKVAFNVKDSTTELTGNLKTKFNTNPVVKIPNADTTVEDLKSEIDSLQDQATSVLAPSSSQYDYSY